MVSIIFLLTTTTGSCFGFVYSVRLNKKLVAVIFDSCFFNCINSSNLFLYFIQNTLWLIFELEDGTFANNLCAISLLFVKKKLSLYGYNANYFYF